LQVEVAVSTETEVKVKIEEAEDFIGQLQTLKPEILSVRHFEDNHLFDYPDGRLRACHCLIRVRYAQGECKLTFKGPPRAESVFKIREELETKLENGEILCRIFEKVGLRKWFRYQKYRREFQLEGVTVAVDETPIGDYVEFEGHEEKIYALARKMRVDPDRFLKDSYYALYMQYCQQKNMVPGDMVF